MNPIQQSNIEFAKELANTLAPRVNNGTGTQITLQAGDVGALFHILTAFIVEHELLESVVQSLKEVL